MERIRADFPILQTKAHGRPLVYLDNAATTQKPRAVIEALSRYYQAENANIHRGVYHLSQHATGLYEEARRKVQHFLNARHAHEIIFTRSATEAINLVAASYGRKHLRSGDEIILSAMEHHSNIVPWQMLCEQTGAVLRVVPFNEAGELQMEEFERLLSPRTKLVAVVHLSNSLGTINPVRRIIELAHRQGAVVLVDGAQWVAHGPTDVQALDCDFYVFSGHKLLGPTGIGVLYGKTALLEAMPPYQGGGDMIESVTFEKTTYAQLPNKFEAGTPNIAGVVGLGAAIDYIQSIGLGAIAAYEQQLFEYATTKLSQVPGLRIIGTAAQKASVISFVMENPPISSLDLGTKLDVEGIAVRTGHHCCQPVMDRFRIPGTARASLSFYNTKQEVDLLVEALKRVVAKAGTKAKPSAAPVVDVAVAFPEPAASAPEEAAQELIEAFEFLGDWEQRDQYVLEMGEKIPPMPAVLKTEENRVHGCMSTVHLFGRKQPGSSDVLEFVADSDAHLVRGLIAILERIYSGQRASAILAFDVEEFFRRLGLNQHLSMGRRNGLQGMVRRIKTMAANLAS